MSNKLHVKKGDTVKVIAGDKKDKKTGKVLEVFPDDGTVVVEDVNILVKHKKARSAKDQGGRIKLPGPIDASNIMVVCPSCNQATRINYRIAEDGGKKNKVRICKKCSAVLDAKVESVKAKKERKEKEKAAKKEKKEKKAKEKKEKTDKSEKAEN